MDPPPNAKPLQAASLGMELAWREGRLPDPEKLASNIWVVPFPTETDFVAYTLSYLLRDERGSFHIIDPGWDTPENRERLVAFLASINGGLADVASTLVSHFHPDHLGMAPFLRESAGAELALSAREQEAIDEPQRRGDPLDEWGVPADRRQELSSLNEQEYSIQPVRADRLVREGDIVGGPGNELRVMETPGHTRGHVSFVSDEGRMVFTGDHLLPRIHPGLGLGAGSGSTSHTLSLYFDGLRRVAQLDTYLVCPGHEYTFWGAALRCAGTARHHIRRIDEVRLILDAMPNATIWDVAKQVTWTAGWNAMRTYRLRSALRQIDMHVAHVRSENSEVSGET